ncbi:MAG TPA: gliding motility lipoprotein GldJ, partial [Chitinophagaceae bacterium]|nr:gliding motility lipoprotein GldJ [Chitinophagaceae bacterium]
MRILTGLKNSALLVATLGILASCNSFKKKQQKSDVTGWAYNDKKNGGFTVAKPKNIKTAP